MKFIQTYEKFNTPTLHIFDLDDTLMNTPSFEDRVAELMKEDVGQLLNRSLKSIGVSINDLKREHGRIYVNDPEEKLKLSKDWVRKGKRVYLTTPDKFYYLDESLPESLRDFADIYKKCDSKAIVTGRTDEMKSKILETLDKFGLEEPNYGLFCYPKSQPQISDRVSVWKGKTIIKLIQESGAEQAYFYEDKSKWLKQVTKMVREKLPNVKFIPVKA